MLPFKSILKFDKNSAEAVYKQIASQLVLLIQKGILMPGMQLPSTRVLAADLGLHRKTIMAAYNALIAEDWIVSHERKEYRVSTLLPIIKPRSYAGQARTNYTAEAPFLFNEPQVRTLAVLSGKHKLIVDDGFPETDIFPVERIAEEYKKLLTHHTLKKASSTWSIGGSKFFKDELAAFLNDTRGLNIEPENLIVTRGAQMAIYLAASLLIKPGDKVLVTSPNYFLADAIFTQLGAQLIKVPVDGEGADVDAIESALINNSIKLLYIIPHHHHPTTVTMSSVRRVKLLRLIKDHQLSVIEDDYDYDFQYQHSPYLPLASGDHNGNVIYIGSLTKVLGANFRLGYMISGVDFLNGALKLKSLIDLRCDVLMESTIASLMQSGEFSRFIKKANKLYNHRCGFTANLLSNELPHLLEFVKPQGGMALWLKFKQEHSLAGILNKASSLGLKFGGSTYLKKHNLGYEALRFGFASIDENNIEFAVDVLKRTL
ncbi:PLP-dependent aminotransferase family protein [Mucilaginibacter gynuensis]|uniref:PLP-dependent aminotransferase family protein n=1 Tax=Mucilaginibacter gynuensis TaxID=1302236 RepID=A0ABP8FTQ9_9SPHI